MLSFILPGQATMRDEIMRLRPEQNIFQIPTQSYRASPTQWYIFTQIVTPDILRKILDSDILRL